MKFLSYEPPIRTLENNEVFVFGSNLDGFHGAGAAGYASFNHPGNVWRKFFYDQKPDGWLGKWNVKGKAVGIQSGTIGRSYAIPTVTRAGMKRSLPRFVIKNYISRFYSYARSVPEVKFYIAQSDITGLNGYTPKEMAECWYPKSEHDNVYFDSSFVPFLEANPMTRRRYSELVEDSVFFQLTDDEKKLGWHYCADQDYLLINDTMLESFTCRCFSYKEQSYN